MEDGERQQRHGRGVLGSDDGQPLEQLLLVGVLPRALRLRKVLRDGRLPTPPQAQRQAAWTYGVWGQVAWACRFGAQRPPRQLQRPDAAPLSARWCGASCPARSLILRGRVAFVPLPAREVACNNRPAGKPLHRSLSPRNAAPGGEGERPEPQRRSRTRGRGYLRRERGPRGVSCQSLAFGRPCARLGTARARKAKPRALRARARARRFRECGRGEAERKEIRLGDLVN